MFNNDFDKTQSEYINNIQFINSLTPSIFINNAKKFKQNININLEIDNWTALRTASRINHVEVVRELIKSGADVNHETGNNWTALENASHNNHIEIVRELIKSGADVNHETGNHWTALRFASRK